MGNQSSVANREVDVFPLVPATWIIGYPFVGPAHVVEQPIDALQAWLDAMCDVPIEIGKGVGIVH